MADKKAELREIAKEQLPESIITIGYSEHQMDIVTMLVLDIVEELDPTNFSDIMKKRIEMLKSIMAHTSIDFDNLDDTFQAYKVPKTIEYKANARKVNAKYLKAQLREGVFGE